jgi:type I restriction enzyme S subunit
MTIDHPRTVLLGHLVAGGQISYGIVQPGNHEPTGVPIVRVGDIRDGRISVDRPLKVGQEIADRHLRTRLHGGELLVSLVGTVGEAAIVPKSMTGWNVARAVAVVKVIDVEAEWIRRFLQTRDARNYLESVLNTTVQATLNLSDLKRLPIAMPDHQTRMAITEVLGALDDKIAVNSQVHRVADELLAAVLQRYIAEGDGTTGKLGDIAIVNGVAITPLSEGNLRYVDIASVDVGRFEIPESSAWQEAPSRARRCIRRGDTLWSTVRPNRRSHALNLSRDPSLVGSTGLAVLTSRDSHFAFLYESTKLPEFTEYLESAAEGSAYPAVRADRFVGAPVPNLSVAARSEFESIAAPMREHLHSLGTESQALSTLRDTLLPQLMSGKLRVKDAEKQLEDVVK